MDATEAQELVNSVAESEDEQPHPVVDNNNKEPVDDAKPHSESEKSGDPVMNNESNDENMEVEEEDANKTADSITDDANDTADSTLNLNDSETMDSLETGEQDAAGNSDDAIGETEVPVKKKKKGRPKGAHKKIAKSKNLPWGVKPDFIFKDKDGDCSSVEIKKKGVDVIDVPELMLPFDLGWTREHVLRGTAEDYAKCPKGSGKKASDVYYFTPEGKKLRSMVEVTEHLYMTHSAMTGRNFTFARCTIYKAPYDVSRFSGRVGRASIDPSPRNSPVLTPRLATPPKPRPATGPMVIKLPAFHKAKNGAGDAPLETSSPKIVNVTSLAAKPKAVARKRTGGRPPSSKRPADSDLASDVAKKPSLQDSYTPRLCGLECAGMEGKQPELQCKLCMCLYHPTCVDYRGSPDVFTCPECSRIKKGTSNQNGGVSVPPPPLHTAPQVVVRPTLSSLLHPPPLTRAAIPSSMGSGLGTSLGTVSLLPGSMGLVGNPMPVVGTTSSGTGVSLMSTGANINLLKTVPVRPPPTLNTMTGHLLTLPLGVASKLNTSAPICLKIGGKDVQVPPSCLITTPQGIKVFLPPGILDLVGIGSGQAKALNITTMSANPQKLVVQSAQEKANRSTSPKTTAPIKVPEVRVLDKSRVRVSRRVYPGINPALCHFQRLHAGVECLSRIFKYLALRDRLQAAAVCKMWKDMARRQSVWKKIELRDHTVTNWEAAVQFMKQVNTTTLDMRGLQHMDGDKNRTWHQFTAVLDQLTQLHHLYFDQCPTQILQSAAEKLCNLRTLSAQFIVDAIVSDAQMWTTNAKLDLSKFSNMEQMEGMRLRGVCGLLIPTGLSHLKGLSHIKYLSLTTLREVNDEEISYLGSLTALEELEFGDCELMGSLGFEGIKKLTRLSRLRLEGRLEVSKNEEQLAETLSSLNKLQSLELIKFAVSDELLKTLQVMTTLKNLTLWPENGSKVAEKNTAVYHSVLHMKSLDTLEWAIMGDQVAEGETSDGKHNNDSVLMLKDDTTPDTSTEADAPADPLTHILSISTLMEKLCDTLPTTKIRVFRLGVPVLCT